MAECSVCGKQEMTFTCRYCGEKYCSEHRLPENHDCSGLEEAETRSGESNDKQWFKQQDLSKETINGKAREAKKPGLLKDMMGALTGKITYLIIAVTTLSFLLQISVPGFSELLFLEPALQEVLRRPWSILTVMLVHGGAFHLFANMITLYFFGQALERVVSPKEMLAFYVGTGLVASIGYIAFRNLLFQLYGPTLGGVSTLIPAVGASGAVIAVFAATAVLYPRAEVLLYFVFPMRIWTALKLFAGIEAVNLGAKAVGITLPLIGNFSSSAHLAGLLIGLYFGRRIRDRKRPNSQFDLLQY